MQPGDLRVRFLTEEEKKEGQAKVYDDFSKIHRLPLRREDFLTHGFTERFPGC